jgi:hypothetical protein
VNTDLCPSAAKNDNIHVRTLHEACLILGGEQKLAEYLGVTAAAVDGWLRGISRPPDRVFLRCVDVILTARSTRGPFE